ncbi:MAG TPA: SHOCT domain-containing protein, partial [Actinocrinis sp.]|uniref:SHOCT domain-containing protein n=1 Tax=Actinocrinis sp. TaxID=1920516 RepID=UPI002D4BE689
GVTIIVPGGLWAWFWTSFASLLLLDLAVVSLVVVSVAAATRLAARRARLEDQQGSTRPQPWRVNPMATMVAEGVLADLYARGDITEDTYRERLSVLRSTDQPPPNNP